MATTYYTTLYNNKTGAVSPHGLAKSSVHLHAISGTISTWALNDTIYIGNLPRGAVVVSAILKAASQLDSNGTPTLTLSLGIVGNTTLFKNAVTTVGRTSGASVDTTIAAAGALYVSPTTADTPVIVTVSAAAATAVAGTVEVDLEYYTEDVAATAP